MTLCESTSSVPCSPSCTHGYGYRCAPTVDLVLLSHGDLSHSGLYAYAYANWGLTAPTYTTLPVQAMARVAASEDVEGIRDEQDVEDKSSEEQSSDDPDTSAPDEPPQSPTTAGRAKKRRYVATSQQVIEAFESVNVLRYSQPCHLQGTSTYFAALSPSQTTVWIGKCQGLTIIPFNAGHTLGGTIWKIRSPSAGTILYAVDMNHMRERHLDGTVLIRQGAAGGGVFETLARPDLLITDAERANVTTARRKDRDAALLGESTAFNLSLFIPHVVPWVDCVTATLSSQIGRAHV